MEDADSVVRRVPARWLEETERSEADYLAGRFVELDVLMNELDQSAAEMEVGNQTVPVPVLRP